MHSLCWGLLEMLQSSSSQYYKVYILKYRSREYDCLLMEMRVQFSHGMNYQFCSTSTSMYNTVKT